MLSDGKTPSKTPLTVTMQDPLPEKASALPLSVEPSQEQSTSTSPSTSTPALSEKKPSDSPSASGDTSSTSSSTSSSSATAASGEANTTSQRLSKANQAPKSDEKATRQLAPAPASESNLAHSPSAQPQQSPAKAEPELNREQEQERERKPHHHPQWLTESLTFVTSRVEWVPKNWTFAKWKPAIRCALVAWISLVLFVIPVVERELGQASFLILIVAFLSPPSDPFLMMLEREILIIFFVCLAWAWTSLGIFLADLTRNFRDPNVTFLQAATGQYIEAAPCVIMGIFIFFGTAFFLFVRARKGPGPYLFPTVLGCICLDISLTTACIFPFPYYLSGRTVVLPLILHTAVSILLSLTVFPSTISALYTTRLVAVLSPLEDMVLRNRELLAVGPYDDGPVVREGENKGEGVKEKGGEKASPASSTSYPPSPSPSSTSKSPTPQPPAPPKAPLPPYASLLNTTRTLTRASEAALAPLAAVGRLLHSDLIYARFKPGDFDAFHKQARRLVGRADGMGVYFGLVEVGLGLGGGNKEGGEKDGGTGGGEKGLSTGTAETNSEGEKDGNGALHVHTGGSVSGAGVGLTPGSMSIPMTTSGLGPKYGRRVESLPISLSGAVGSGTSTPTNINTKGRRSGTRTPVHLHQHHQHTHHAPRDAHAQLHMSSSALALADGVGVGMGGGMGVGRRSGSATPVGMGTLTPTTTRTTALSGGGMGGPLSPTTTRATAPVPLQAIPAHMSHHLHLHSPLHKTRSGLSGSQSHPGHGHSHSQSHSHSLSHSRPHSLFQSASRAESRAGSRAGSDGEGEGDDGDDKKHAAHRSHALHLHHSLLTLARTLSHATGHSHKRDGESSSDEDDEDDHHHDGRHSHGRKKKSKHRRHESHDHKHGHGHDDDHERRPFSRKAEWAVGTFESQRYMNLEATRLHDPRAEEWTRLTFGLLRESCTPFLGLCALGLNTAKSWLTNDVRSGRLKHFLGIKREEAKKRREDRRREIEAVRDKVKEGLRVFREEERHLVLQPYLRAFEHSVAPSAAVTPHVSPPGSPLRTTVSLPQMDAHGAVTDREVYAPAAAGDDVRETTPMIDAVVDGIVSGTREGGRAERDGGGGGVGGGGVAGDSEESNGNESSSGTIVEMFSKPSLEEMGVRTGEDAHDADKQSGEEVKKRGERFEKKPLHRESEPKHAHSQEAGGADAHYSAPIRDSTSYSHSQSHEMPPHRYLFHCYVYQYNLIQIGEIIIEMLEEILRLEEERQEPKLWTPVTHLFTWTPWFLADTPEQTDDDDPDVIQGFHQKELEKATGVGEDTPTGAAQEQSTSHLNNPSHGQGQGLTAAAAHKFKMNPTSWYEPETEDLGLPRRRDPDSLPPRNALEWFFGLLSRLVIGLGGGNSVYAWKAGVLTVLLCLPSFIKSSAAFALENRFSWGIFMGQLSLARFRGDTTFSLVTRVSSTFFGGLTGMVMWYISAGTGNGSPFGLAATCLVCFPFFFFARLYWPVHPMMNIVFFVTAVLVVGYSYQDQHVVTPGAPGTGFSVFWKRVLLVSAGVFAAFIASFLPPSTTIRRYQRSLLATTSAEMGTIYCAILSFANTKHEQEIQDIVVSLIALRSKLTRSNALRTNVGYEFSLRGRWPAERYQAVADLQMALAYSLSHLMSVLKHLESSWARAFLRRTRFMDPDFQGDILAVVSMISSSLRNGTPLPQITPCPLLDRFTHKYHGLDVIHKDSEEDYGLPRNLSIETLRNEQYLMFCVGVSIAYGIINRLDKLMLAVKEIVGEQYHIHGVGLRPYESGAHHPSGYEQGPGRVRFTGGIGIHPAPTTMSS